LRNKPQRKYEAVIFDLGGTLSRSAAWSEYRNAARKMAEICGAPIDDFIDMWFSESSGLGTGVYPGYGDYIRYICEKMDLRVPENRIDLAAREPYSITQEYVTKPREGAIEVLSYLKSRSYKIGLISDCAPELPEIWNDTIFAPYFDATVFSCTAGMNKADPRIFQIAVEKLAVKPEKCMYIADGMRNELANAKKLGMHAVQILVPGEIDDSPIREEWHGPVITSLKEVLDLLR
jgi:putative hydrolase of the HAD superfamily